MAAANDRHSTYFLADAGDWTKHGLETYPDYPGAMRAGVLYARYVHILRYKADVARRKQLIAFLLELSRVNDVLRPVRGLIGDEYRESEIIQELWMSARTRTLPNVILTCPWNLPTHELMLVTIEGFRPPGLHTWDIDVFKEWFKPLLRPEEIENSIIPGRVLTVPPPCGRRVDFEGMDIMNEE